MPTMPTAQQTQKFQGAVRSYQPVQADATGELPKDIMLIKTGAWGNSVKGALTITSSDLREMKENFDNGVGRFGGGTVGLPIDFGHAEWDKAAAWINELEIRGSGEETQLWSVDTEWTASGAAAVKGGDYKGISPSFYPSDRGGYVDPEDYDSEAKPNTLVGAALTNIPFMKGLTAVKADNFAQDDNNGNMLFISGSNNNSKKDNTMTKNLDQVRIMAAADLQDEDKELLRASAADLSADEKTKFAEILADNKPQDQPVQLSADDRQILADIKSGAKVVMSAAEKSALESKIDAATTDVKALKRQKIEADITEKAIKTGKIVADQLPKWADLVEADEKNMELLTSLPSNQVVADANGEVEKGKEGKDIEVTASALQTKTLEILKASAAEGKPLSHADAKIKAQAELEKEG